MPIVVNLDVVMAQRKISAGDLAKAIDITPANLSVLKNGKAKAVRFTTWKPFAKRWSVSQEIFWSTCQKNKKLRLKRENFKTEKRTNYYRVATILMSLGIFASTLFIKQHVIADVFGGIAAFEIGMILAKILI